MAEQEKTRGDLELGEQDPRLYYDYEGRFVKQRLERDRMRLLPRVVKPEMFAKTGHALGDVRVFERFTVGPVSALTCRFVDVPPGGALPEMRRIPLLTMFVISGSGVSIQEGVEHRFGPEDVVIVPPYTRFSFVAGADGFRAWIPETRFWHVLGLLWTEHLEAQDLAGLDRLVDDDGRWRGYRVPDGMFGLDREMEIPGGADPRRDGVFGARRTSTASPQGATWYDDLLRLLQADNDRYEATPRVITGEGVPWEETRGGRMKFYVSNWTELAGQDLDLAMYEIAPGGRTGAHRHIAEELLLVLEGSGVDEHDGSEHAWAAGDLICIPPMAAHLHANDGDVTARLVSVWSHHPANEYLGGFEHISDGVKGGE